jgi:hypothetical protein
MLILNFFRRKSYRVIRGTILLNFSRNKRFPNFCSKRSSALLLRALISPVALLLLPSAAMHESISRAVACRKSNIHGVVTGTSANECSADSSISLLDNFSSLFSLFSFSPDPCFRFLTKCDSADRALIAPLTFGRVNLSEIIRHSDCGLFCSSAFLFFHMRGTFYRQFLQSFQWFKRVAKLSGMSKKSIQHE